MPGRLPGSPLHRRDVPVLRCAPDRPGHGQQFPKQLRRMPTRGGSSLAPEVQRPLAHFQLMIIHFQDVGRDKLCWDEQTDNPVSMAALVLNILKRKGCLRSRYVDVDWSEDTMSGEIIVGGFRCVGRFTVEESLQINFQPNKTKTQKQKEA